MTFSETLHNYSLYFLLALLLLAGLYSSIAPGMVVQWYQDDNYSHGFLVPVVAGYFLYQRRDELMKTRVVPSNSGLVIILLALLQLAVASFVTEYFTLRSSLVVLIAGLVIYFFGTEIMKIVRLPILYLFFMVPLPYIVYDAVAFPLKLFVTKASVGFLKVIGIIVLREGNIIMFPATTLEVADACSGIRSLVSLIALAVAYAFFIECAPVKRWIIIVSAVPIALLTNAMRVIVTGILAQHWGAAAAEGFFHEFAGMAVFLLAMALLVATGTLLCRKSR